MKQHSRILTHRSRHFFFSLCGNVLHQRVKSQRPNLKRAYCSFFASWLFISPSMFLRSVISVSYNHGQKSWDTFAFWGVFQYTQAQPLPSLHKSWTRVSGTDLEFFSQFQLCIGWGEGEMEEYFEKDALFYEGTQNREKNMNTALLSQ